MTDWVVRDAEKARLNSLSDEDIDLLLRKLGPVLWNGKTVAQAMLRLGWFVGRCSDGELSVHLNSARRTV